MTFQSRILIADIVANTALSCSEIECAPKPLPANYGQAVGFAHMMDLSMMKMINSMERTPTQFRRIVKDAGLVLVKIWETRNPFEYCRVSISLFDQHVTIHIIGTYFRGKQIFGSHRLLSY